MRTLLVSEYIDRLRSTIGLSGADDLLYAWLRSAYSAIRERQFPWNWRVDFFKTLDIYDTDGSYNFSYDAGDTYITSDVVLPNSLAKYTGRLVQIDDRWLRIVEIGLTDPNRIYLDSAVTATVAVADAAPLVFYRGEFVVNSSSISSVRNGVTGRHARVSKGYFDRNAINSDFDDTTVGTPTAYVDDSDRIIPPPAYPPLVVDSGAGALTNGRYAYYFTRVDFETGLESDPGPVTEVNVTSGNAQNVTYNNPASANDSEETTYFLRLYRTEVNSRRDDPPFYRLLTRNPFNATAGTFTDDSDGIGGVLYGFEKKYDGPQVRIMIFPIPDGEENLTFKVRSVDAWDYALSGRERINIGDGAVVEELVLMYVSAMVESTRKNTEAFFKQTYAFRKQLGYHAIADSEPGESDRTDVETEVRYVRDAQQDPASWVDDMVQRYDIP